MKKIVFVSFAAALFANVAMADVYRESVDTCDGVAMRSALDRAATQSRAVITIVDCDNVRVQPVETCGCGCQEKQAVVKREYFVRETIQTYKPVVKYVPATTYTRVRPVCKYGC